MNKIVPLENGLFELCRKNISEDEKYKNQNKGIDISRIDKLVFEEYRLYRLKETVKYAYENSRFYKKLFDDNGIKPEDIQEISDLARLPFTNPRDLAAREYDLLCISQSKVEKPVTFTSSGTTGPQKRVFFSDNDIEQITDFLGVGMNTVTGSDGVIQILLPSGSVRGQSELLAEGLRKKGMKAYHTGLFLPSEEQVKASIANKATVWFGETRLIYRITKEMEKKYELSKLGLRVIFVTTSYLSDNMRKYLEKTWDCKVCTHYGLTEMGLGLAVECPEGEGYHYNQFGVIAELVNPETGEPINDGQEGELVFTSLGREAMPLIRYRSHDIARLSNEKCACGSHLQTISTVKRRLEAIVYLNEETEIYPTMFDDLLFSVADVVDYDIYLEKGDRPRLIFKVETITERDNISHEMEKVLADFSPVKNAGFKVEVEILPSGTLRGGVHFKKLIKM